MTKFIATFSDGQTIVRNSDRAYAFAYAVIGPCGIIKNSGFSADRANAAKAAEASLPKGISSRDRKSLAMRYYHAQLAKAEGLTYQQWVAKINEDAAARRAALRVEIVAI